MSITDTGMQYGYRYISLSLAFILALFVLNRMKLEQVKIALSSFLEVSQGRALRAPGRAPLFWGWYARINTHMRLSVTLMPLTTISSIMIFMHHSSEPVRMMLIILMHV